MAKNGKILNAAIIGCGGIATGKHLPALEASKRAAITAFCDIIPEKAAKCAEKYGAKGAKVYEDYRRLLEDDSIDIVHVCTPNRSHSAITVAALESGKHVMCEKPMAKDVAGARAMCEAAERTGKQLTIGYQSRFREDSQYLKKACVRGDLGEIYFAKAHAIRRRAVPTWGVFLNEEEQGGGPLIDIGTHALDLTLWLMDNYQPKTVTGSVYRKLADRKDAANMWGSWDPLKYTVEDSAFAYIQMRNGATIFLESSWALNTLDEGEAICTLCGTEGGADFRDGLRLNGEEFSRKWTKKPDLGAGGVAFFEGESLSPTDLECRQWLDAVVNGTKPLVLPRQALVVTEILDAVYRSAKTGKPVAFK
jgi:predicted dehydrogenase